MKAGADMAAVSMHKSGGSLTQSSILLLGPHMDEGYVSSVINLTQTTSASYLLMASLDISRRNLALRGAESFSRVVDMAEYARREINEIGGYYAYGSELINGGSIYDFDVTKLAVYTRGIGLTGIEVYDLLRDEYDIQVEFGDLSYMLAYISIGDRIQDIERLVGALADIKRLYSKPETNLFTSEYYHPHRGGHPRRRPFTPRRNACPSRIPPGASAASLSCATRRASPSWRRARSSPKRSSTTSSLPRKRAARCRARPARIFRTSMC